MSSSKSLIVAGVVLLLAATAANAAHYFSGDRQIPLLIDSLKVTMRFESDVPGSHVEQLIANVERIVASLDDPFAIDYFIVCSLATDDGYTAFLDSLRSIDEIGWVEPYYVDTGGQPHLVGNTVCAAFAPGISPGELDSTLIAHGLQVKETLLENVYSLQRTDTSETSILQASNELYASPQTLFSHPDFSTPVIRHTYTAYDYYAGLQWQIHRVVGEFNVASVWDFEGVDAPIVVAVIDDGFIHHEDFPLDRIVAGADFVSGGKWPHPFATDGHGMACAGVIGATHSRDSLASDSSASGVISINPEVHIMPIRAFEQGAGQTPLEMAKAITWPWKHGVWVLSNSWGYRPGYEYDVVTAAIDSARAFGRAGLGCAVVFSSGNNGSSSVAYPAKLASCLAVGATEYGGYRFPYSQYGPELDLVAPSGATNWQGDVWSLDQMGYLGYNPQLTESYGHAVDWNCGFVNDEDYNCNFGGTSAAAPVVAGVASLVLSKDSTLSTTAVYDVLRGSAARHLFAHTLPDTHTVEYGYGRVDAFRAILSLVRGDVNNSGGEATVSDLSYLVDYLFHGGPAPFPSLLQADCNCSGDVNVSDLDYLVAFLFEGSPNPVRPCFEYGD